MKTTSRMLAATAALGLVFAPVAAQANTRAGDSNSVYSTSAPGVGRDDDGESLAGASSILLALLAAGLIVAGIFFATDSDDEGQSPGT